MNEKEIWKPVSGYEGVYEVSNLGRVKSLSRHKACGHKGSKPQITEECLLSIREDRYGYKRVKLSKNKKSHLKYLHRILAKEIIPNPEGKPQINHKDGDKGNNSLENLEWTTQKENVIHAFATGLIKPRTGEKNSLSKLKEFQVKEIRKLYKQGATQKELSKVYKVSIATISGIVNFKTWKEIS